MKINLKLFLSALVLFVLKPIRRLLEAVREINSGNLAAERDVETGDELGALAVSIQQLTDNLRVAKEELASVRDRTGLLLDCFREAVFVVSPEGVYETVNAKACSLLSCSAEDIIGKPFADLFISAPPLDLVSSADMKGNEVDAVEAEYRTRDGGSVMVLFSSVAMYRNGGEFAGVFCRAAKREAEQSFQGQDWLSSVVDYVDEAVVITDTEGVIQYVNPSFTEITGYSPADAIGAQESILRSGSHDEAYYKDIQAMLAKGESWSGHFVNRKKSGSLYEEECTIIPVRNRKGEIRNFVSLRSDVTNVMRLEKNLAQAQKHEALGTLAGGIAHDFNNILTAILGYTAISMSSIEKNSKAYESMEKVVKAGRRAADLVSQILAFSRQKENEPQPMQLQPVVKEALKLLRGTLPTTIEIRENIDSGCGAIFADVTQVHQVVMNLCTNAYHAMRKKGGVLTVSLESTEIDPKFGPHQPDLPSGKYAKLSVIDTGHGMDMATLERIFEPYFTTKGAGEGTGLGLAMVHGIVDSHHGAVTVQSHQGQGTTFCVYLPVYARRAGTAEEKPEYILPSLKGYVLFVDDEELIAGMGKELLEGLGCEVETYTSSLEALEAFRRDPTRYDVVITDQTMPRMTGIVLAREILAIRPELPIILCTGYSESINENQAKTEGVKEFFMKPLEIHSLAAVVLKYLPGGPGGQ